MVKIDATMMTLGDALDLSDPNISMRDKVAILERFVTEGSLRDLPIKDLGELMKDIDKQIELLLNPTTGLTGSI